MNVKLSRNADGTITVRVGRAVEHVDPIGKTHAQLFDAVKWALVSKSATLDDLQIAERLQQIGAYA